MRFTAKLLFVLWGVSAVGADPETRLVQLKVRPAGLLKVAEYWAESNPQFDHTCSLPQRFSVRGLDRGLLQAASTNSGLPVRLSGKYSPALVTVQSTAGPALQPLDLRAQAPWRGVVAIDPAAGRFASAPGRWQSYRWHAAPSSAVRAGLYRVNGWNLDGVAVLADPVFLGPVSEPAALQGGTVVLCGEAFLGRTLGLVREQQPQRFRWIDPTGSAQLRLDDLGVTGMGGQGLLGYGRLDGRIDLLGFSVQPFKGEWEAQIALPSLRSRAVLQRPRLRITDPLLVDLPAELTDVGLSLLDQLVGGLRWPLPGPFAALLLERGLISEAQLEKLRLGTGSWGDRRSSAIWLDEQGGHRGSPPAEFGDMNSDEFALGLEAEAVDRLLAKEAAAALPLRLPVPEQERVGAAGLVGLEIDTVEARFERGVLSFSNCRVGARWKLGPLSGVERVARLSGRLLPNIEDGKLWLGVELDSVEPVSERWKGQWPELESRIRQAARGQRWQMPFPTRLPTELLPLEIVRIRLDESRLWLVGRWGA